MGEISFSQENLGNTEKTKAEFKMLGWETSKDILDSALSRIISEELSARIRNCDLSIEALQEAVEAFGGGELFEELIENANEDGIRINIDADVRPDISNITERFAEAVTSEDSEEGRRYYTQEQMRVLNFLDWQISTHPNITSPHRPPVEYFGDYLFERGKMTYNPDSGQAIFFSCERQAVHLLPREYPYNLVADIFGDMPNLCVLPSFDEQLNNILGTLTPREEKYLRFLYQNNLSPTKILEAYGLPQYESLLWGIQEVPVAYEAVISKALRKLRHPARSKKIRTPRFGAENLMGGNTIEVTYITKYTERKKVLLEENSDKTFEEIRQMHLWGDMRTEESIKDEDIIPPIKTLEYCLASSRFYEIQSWETAPIELFRDSVILKAVPSFPQGSIKRVLVCSDETGKWYLLFKICSSDADRLLLCSWDEKEPMNELKRILLPDKFLWYLHDKIQSYTVRYFAEGIEEPINAEFSCLFASRCAQSVEGQKEKDFYEAYALLFQKRCTEQLRQMPYGDKLLLPIEELDLSVRAYNCLKRANIFLVVDLISKNFDEMKNIKNLGSKCFEEIIKKIDSINIQWFDKQPGKTMMDSFLCSK